MNNGRTLAATAWSTLILVLCWLPRHWIFAIERRRAGGFALGELNLDKFVHVALFAGFGWLWMRAMRERVGDPVRRARLVLVAGLAFALLSEAVQALPAIGRTAHLVDLACDAAGVAAGVWVGWMVASRPAAVAPITPEA